MRFNILVFFLSIGKEGISGGDVHIVEVTKRWIDNGNLVNIVTNQYGVKLIRQRGNPCSIEVIKIPTFLDKMYGRPILATFITQTWLVFKVIKALPFLKNVDIAIAASTSLPDTVGLLLSKAKISKAMFAHHFIPPPIHRMKLGSSLYNAIAMFMWNQIAYAIARVNKWIVFAAYSPPFLRAGFDRTLLVEIDGGAPLDIIDQIKPASEMYEAVYLGRLAFNKGILDLVNIWRLVVNEFPSAKLGIIGTGDPHIVKTLVYEIKKAGLERNVKLLGFVDDSTKYGLLKSSKIFVYPSYEEGFGIVIVEAMACGLPVACYNLPAYNRFSKPLLLANIGDIQDLAKHVISLLKNDNKRKKIATESIVEAKKYNWDVIASKELKCMVNNR